MASNTATCRIRFKFSAEADPIEFRFLADAEGAPDSEMRFRWTRYIWQEFVHGANEPENRSHIRDWDLVLSVEDGVQNVSQNSMLTTHDQADRIYPVEYRIPAFKIAHLSSEADKVSRQEIFAIGSLLCELNTLQKPFQDLAFTNDMSHTEYEQEITSRFAAGQVPDGTWQLPNQISTKVLRCWCPELTAELQEHSKGNRNSHLRTSLQVIGATIAVGSLAVFPVLGIAGFSAMGPVAGSAAAAWQSSLGLVQAGSMFAWCQSVAMGGTAVGGLVATGAAGGVVSASLTAHQLLGRTEFDKLEIEASDLQEMYQKAWVAVHGE